MFSLYLIIKQPSRTSSSTPQQTNRRLLPLPLRASLETGATKLNVYFKLHKRPSSHFKLVVFCRDTFLKKPTAGQRNSAQQRQERPRWKCEAPRCASGDCRTSARWRQELLQLRLHGTNTHSYSEDVLLLHAKLRDFLPRPSVRLMY